MNLTKETFSEALQAIKGVSLPFTSSANGTGVVADAPASSPSPGFVASLTTTATNTTGGLPNWILFLGSLGAVGAAVWFFIFKKKKARRRRR